MNKDMSSCCRMKRNSLLVHFFQIPRSQSAKTPSSQRMTQSMYAKRPAPDDRRTSSDSVSFFVEFPNTPAAVGACGSAGNSSNQTRMIKSMSREEPPCQELSSMSDEMQEKSRVLMLKNLEHTKKFFNKLKGCIDFLQVKYLLYVQWRNMICCNLCINDKMLRVFAGSLIQQR